LLLRVETGLTCNIPNEIFKFRRLSARYLGKGRLELDKPEPISPSADHASQANSPDAPFDAQSALQIFNIAGRMAGAAAHDFNNILTGILGNLELMQRRANRQGITEFNDYLTGARSAASRGVDYAQSLLAVAGFQPLEPKHISAASFIENLPELISAGIAAQATIHATCAAPPDLICDEAKLEDAVLELAKNAAEAGARTITITAAPEHLNQQQAAHFGINPGAYLALAITDDGAGMNDETAARGFEPFFSTKNAPGLGLAKTLGFARQSGGHAHITAHQSGHTIITLLLPAAIKP
jgi:signal transduction histidine kinase